MRTHRWNIPGQGHGHGAIFGHHHPATKHGSAGFIAVATGRRSYGIKRKKRSPTRVYIRGSSGSRLVLARGANQFIMRIGTIDPTGSIGTTTKRFAAIETIAPQKLARWWHVDAHIVPIRIIPVDWSELGVNEAHLQHMSCSTPCIERNGVMQGRFHILRSLTRADIRLYHVQPIMRG